MVDNGNFTGRLKTVFETIVSFKTVRFWFGENRTGRLILTKVYKGEI